MRQVNGAKLISRCMLFLVYIQHGWQLRDETRMYPRVKCWHTDIGMYPRVKCCHCHEVQKLGPVLAGFRAWKHRTELEWKRHGIFDLGDILQNMAKCCSSLSGESLLGHLIGFEAAVWGPLYVTFYSFALTWTWPSRTLGCMVGYCTAVTSSLGLLVLGLLSLMWVSSLLLRSMGAICLPFVGLVV